MSTRIRVLSGSALSRTQTGYWCRQALSTKANAAQAPKAGGALSDVPALAGLKGNGSSPVAALIPVIRERTIPDPGFCSGQSTGTEEKLAGSFAATLLLMPRPMFS